MENVSKVDIVKFIYLHVYHYKTVYENLMFSFYKKNHLIIIYEYRLVDKKCI